ncbi:protein NRT1/ PTR FAMILY 5.2-like [Dioscorea cayenensis subsp. rotundata]|uniref:Protein NRT1/ PTR FAMILY 5.2-like n=1 Tax=Dioscorea cayennensis subsp. rotundata TaxID=55577 RepID=A0AB40CJ90_DIOCR|nr:protein NRT1/ PTR FAMILY 5.2-like [Dioscorea cayenensis subsp. rotundata]
MAENLENGQGDHHFTKDGTVDLKGNPVLRSKRGGWKACSFIVVYEVFERMAYYGISSNLFIYLTKRLHQGVVEAANNVTNWAGTVFLVPLVGAYIADAYLGRYWTFVAGSVIYVMGMCLLVIAVSIPSLRPPPCATTCKPATTMQLAIFFSGLYILALGNGGTKPNISTMGADQFDDFDPIERTHKLSFFNWWMFSIFLGTLFANTVLVYLQDNVGWSLGYGIPLLGLAVSVCIFLFGTSFYRHKVPQGSPFTRMAKVVVAALKKWRVVVPSDPKDLHELDLEEYAKKSKTRIDSTDSLRFLNRAAVKNGKTSPWILCAVTQVEETKQIFRMLPIIITMFIPCTMIAQVNTLFIKQGTTLNRHIGPHFQIPPASLAAFLTISMLVSVVIYDRFFVNFMRNITKNPRGITLLQRIGVGVFIQSLIFVIAAFTERWRLSVARKHGLEKGGQVPLSIFIILPQFVIMGISDAFLVVGKLEFFYDQAPESMKSLGTACSLTAYGVGNFLSSVLLSTVTEITRRNDNAWVMDNLNASHLDYYYALLAVLSFVNFLVFLLVSKFYSYKAEDFNKA